MLRFHIPNMSCGGRPKSVTKALLSVDPQARIGTNPHTREVRVDSAVDESAFLAVLSGAARDRRRGRFFAGPDASIITGSALTVDGGANA